jgi:predicted kinase
MLWNVGRQHGAAVGAFYWDLPLKTLLERNASREKRVPDHVVVRCFNTLENITPEEADKIKIFDS